MQTFKVVVLGASGTGKTSLTVRFVNGDFIETYDPTIEDLYRKVIETNRGEHVMLEIMDTSGTERYLAMRDLYIRNAQAFVLVYSITSRVSLLELENIKNYICQVKDRPISQIPMVVLGNKCDLEDTRVVFPEEVEALTKKWGIEDFLETSAKIDMNIQSAYDCLTLQLISKQSFLNGSSNGKDKKEKKEKKTHKKSGSNSSSNTSSSSLSVSGGSNLSISSSCSSNSFSTLSSSLSNSTSSASVNNLNQSQTNSPIRTKSKRSLKSAKVDKNSKGKCLIM
ncbi:hypothetical protein RB653_006598 [Dictyostelium firmibasis]|uniref:small monomeric GTPase n=1 Tax=Dictyostelium firmibasis TaxID=79012 RepID=A0AAN7YWD7_9MYCE